MSLHDFTALFGQYPAIIEKMQQEFTSHEFILELAAENQLLYLDALNSYKDQLHRGAPAPFLMVHGVLAQHLQNFPELIEQTDKNAISKDIFGHDNACSMWRKIVPLLIKK